MRISVIRKGGGSSAALQVKFQKGALPCPSESGAGASRLPWNLLLSLNAGFKSAVTDSIHLLLLDTEG